MNFGDFLKNRRKELGLTLRKFCNDKGYDPAYISRLENNLLQPPSDQEKMKALAKALELEEETTQWVEFFDAAAIAKGMIPEDIITESPQFLKMLPAFYRSIRNSEVTDEDLKKINSLLRKSKKDES